MELKPMIEAASRMLGSQIDAQIDDAEAVIASKQRKIKSLRQQKAAMLAMMKEAAKPPKPFKMPRMTKAQRKAMEHNFPVQAVAN